MDNLNQIILLLLLFCPHSKLLFLTPLFCLAFHPPLEHNSSVTTVLIMTEEQKIFQDLHRIDVCSTGSLMRWALIINLSKFYKLLASRGQEQAGSRFHF